MKSATLYRATRILLTASCSLLPTRASKQPGLFRARRPGPSYCAHSKRPVTSVSSLCNMRRNSRWISWSCLKILWPARRAWNHSKSGLTHTAWNSWRNRLQDCARISAKNYESCAITIALLKIIPMVSADCEPYSFSGGNLFSVEKAAERFGQHRVQVFADQSQIGNDGADIHFGQMALHSAGDDAVENSRFGHDERNGKALLAARHAVCPGAFHLLLVVDVGSLVQPIRQLL